MTTQTLHYHLIKPASADRVAVGDINDNSDVIDGYLFQANERADQLADDYNPSSTYNTGDYVRRENYLYKCNTDNTTGTWDVTKWDRVKVMAEISQGGGGGSSTLAGLNDVNISSPSTGQALIYNSTTQKWENGAGGGGSSTLAGLTDVSVTGASNKDTLSYNSTSQKWEKSSRLTDLELTVSQMSASTLGITEGHHILKADGTQMAQEDDLQFVGSNVADDGTNGKTVVTNCINVTQAEYDALVANDEDLPDVYYNITDAQPVAVNASNLPYSSTQSTKQKIDNVESSIPTSASDLPYDSNTSTKQAIDSVNSNVPQMMQVQFAIPTITQINADTTATVLNHFDIRNSTITDGLHDNAQLKTLLGGKTLLGFVFLYSNSSVCCQVDAILWEGEQTISLAIRNLSSSAINISAVRLLVFYK